MVEAGVVDHKKAAGSAWCCQQAHVNVARIQALDVRVAETVADVVCYLRRSPLSHLH